MGSFKNPFVNTVVDFKTVQKHRNKKDLSRFLKTYNKALSIGQDLAHRAMVNEDIMPVDIGTDEARTECLREFRDMLKEQHVLPLMVMYTQDNEPVNRLCFLADVDLEERMIYTISLDTDKVRLEDIMGIGVEGIDRLALVFPRSNPVLVK